MSDRWLVPGLIVFWLALVALLQYRYQQREAPEGPDAVEEAAAPADKATPTEKPAKEPKRSRRAGSGWPDDYDALIRKYSKHYFGVNHDWRWFKAQAIAESGLKPDARSYVGAVGVMQIMPRTYEEIRGDNPQFGDLHETRWNIAAGIYYNRYLYDRWRRIEHPDERRRYMFASYNAGYSRINRAVRNAGSTSPPWKLVEPFAPSQTRHYVRKIEKIRTEDLAH